MDGITENTQTPSVVADTAPAAPVSVPSTAPDVSVAQPAVAPAETPITPVDAPATTETPSPATDAPAETPADSDADNILGGEEKPAEQKPVEEAPKEGEAKPEGETKPVNEPAPLPTYEEFKLPEGYSADPESIGEFSKLLGELEVAAGKLDHKGYQEAGQKLIDLGTKNVQQSIERLNQYYENFHKEQTQKRFAALKADPVMGGEKFTETVSLLQRAVAEYGGTPEQVVEFRKEITESGLYASPALSRILYNMQQKINKYETENGGNRIVPGAKPAPSKVKPYQTFYSGNGQ
jgi:hypothetical protein